jgi:hypothetical protein
MGTCTLVSALRDALDADLHEHFDCALANLYVSGGAAACAWHRDPEHGDEFDGAKWARPTYAQSRPRLMPHQPMPYQPMPYHDISCHAISSHAVPYHTMPYHTISS